jgi:hypothetical protein
MKYRTAWGAVALGVVAALACVPDPARKESGDGGGGVGLTNVTTGQGGDTGAASSAGGTVGGGGDPGAAGAGGDTASGTGGDTLGTVGPGGTTGAAGSGAAGSGAAGSSAAGSSGGGGSAVGGTVGAAGATGTGTVGAGGTTGSGGAGGIALGGTGGTVQPANPCERAAWTFTASVVCTTNCAGMSDAQKLSANAIDGDVNTRWTTGIKQGSAGAENVVLSFPTTVSLTGISLYAKATTDAPNMYHVEYATDGVTFQDFVPALAGPGTTTLLIPFPARTSLRAVRVTQTGTWPHWWSINELTVVGCMLP